MVHEMTSRLFGDHYSQSIPEYNMCHTQVSGISSSQITFGVHLHIALFSFVD